MNDFSNEVCAVILTGGKSSRMGGGIKSLKKFNNKLIFDRIFENLQNQVQKIIINSNDLENLFINYNVEIIKDSIKGFLGPLAGIHAALECLTVNETHIKWLVSVPGDTPFIPNDLVKQLLDKAKKDKHQIVLAQSNKKTHPIILNEKKSSKLIEIDTHSDYKHWKYQNEFKKTGYKKLK